MHLSMHPAARTLKGRAVIGTFFSLVLLCVFFMTVFLAASRLSAAAPMCNCYDYMDCGNFNCYGVGDTCCTECGPGSCMIVYLPDEPSYDGLCGDGMCLGGGLKCDPNGYICKHPQGHTCGSDSDCMTDNYCVDGYCCDTTCTGACEQCNKGGSQGTCTKKNAGDNGDCQPCNICDGTEAHRLNCQPETGAYGYNCPVSGQQGLCTWCSSGSCIERNNHDTTECGPCAECNGQKSEICVAFSGADGKYCNDECTYCSSGNCVDRARCAQNECTGAEATWFCNSGGGSCVNPDANTQAGENVCEACVSGAEHNYGESWDFEGGTTQYCCEDDSSENYNTRVCSSGCTSSTSDAMCCNVNSDCVYTGSCYTSGSNYCAPWNADVIGACSSNSWSLVENCATKASEDSDNGNLPLVAGSLKDYTTCQSSTATCAFNTYADVCTSGTSLTEYFVKNTYSYDYAMYGCAGIEQPAVDTDGGNILTANGQCTPGMAASCINGAFVKSTGTGGGTDHCEGTCGTGTNSCNYIEYYPIDSSDSCADLDSCASIPYDPDTNQNTCNTCLTSGDRWNIGGIAGCCGDDANEYLRAKVCDTFACTSNPNDNACCNQDTDCVNSDTCYNSGDTLPGLPGATCVSGTWRDTTAPQTTINPNSVNYNNNNQSSFTLTCTDTGDARGPQCEKSYYKIINDGEGCGTTGYTDGVSGMVTCQFGQICNKRVCFYSADRALNQESIKMSGIFHLETNACMNSVACGDVCIFSPGVCNASSTEHGSCYAQGGCLLNCSLPQLGPGQTRIWYPSHENCGRSNATKCGPSQVCDNSITDGYCSMGGTSTAITAGWGSYSPASGYYGVGYTFHVNLFGVASAPATFSVLAECEVVKANGNMIFFDSWDSTSALDIDFSYTITGSDPEGEWNITYCSLWSDFSVSNGWLLKNNGTLYHFFIDKTAPAIVINTPHDYEMFSADIDVNATVTDALSGVDAVACRWENATSTGAWVPMSKTGNDYTATIDVSQISDGYYNITVQANDTVGNTGQRTVRRLQIDRQPPDITVLSPSPGWYRSNFMVRATVTDNQGVGSVVYRWENATNEGPWTAMPKESGDNYAATFAVGSVASGNYTVRIWANDTRGNNVNTTVQRVGIDYINPSSQMTQPAKGSYIMSKLFNISWTGSDAHSGVKCYYVTFWYCDQTSGTCSEDQYNVTFPAGKCTSLSQFEFDTAIQTWWVPDPNNYTYYFKAIALDNAGNYEVKPMWETNVTIYIPKLITFYLTENSTKAEVRNGGKVANNREVIISVNAKESIQENLNITIYYSNHTFGKTSSWLSKSCMNTRSCNASITINVTETQNIMEVDYYLFAENASTKEFLPPNAPTGYFYYTVYFHPLCNFLAFDEFRMVLGSIELVAIEIRNIQNAYDNVTLQLVPSFGKFVETSSPYQSIVLNPMEEKTVYARIVSQASDFDLILTGTSQNDLELMDQDTVRVVIGFPPNFSELSDFSALVLVLLAGLIYFGFVRTRP